MKVSGGRDRLEAHIDSSVFISFFSSSSLWSRDGGCVTSMYIFISTVVCCGAI